MTCRARPIRGRRHRRACPGGPRLLAVPGELDAFTASGLAEQLARRPSVRVLDLSGVRFIDASGLRILIDATRADPKLVIRANSACVRRLCTIAGLDGIPSVRPTSGRRSLAPCAPSPATHACQAGAVGLPTTVTPAEPPDAQTRSSRGRPCWRGHREAVIWYYTLPPNVGLVQRVAPGLRSWRLATATAHKRDDAALPSSLERRAKIRRSRSLGIARHQTQQGEALGEDRV